jgi:uncharacterized protein
VLFFHDEKEEGIMDDTLRQFILQERFPCMMAKSVLKKGLVNYHEVENLTCPDQQQEVRSRIYQFVDTFRHDPERLSSFILGLQGAKYQEFAVFEKAFWEFMKSLRTMDLAEHEHDPRVGSDPEDPNFSFSLKGEAFFILTLHPESPRLARRFVRPLIVFNPHQQFENLRRKGLFKRVQSIIRKKDQEWQGTINPMLTDFGERSEVFQYLGIPYSQDATSPL